MTVKIVGIEVKLEWSLKFLHMDRTKASIYVAVNCWADEPNTEAARSTFRFGILSGSSLEVQEPDATLHRMDSESGQAKFEIL